MVDLDTRPTSTGATALDTARGRFLRRRKAVRRRLWRRLLLVLAGLAVVAGVVWLVMFSAVLSVHGVSVTGTSVLTDEEVVRAARVPLGGPLATADLDAVAARVEGLAPVASVEVQRAWPDRVLVVVEERVAVAAVSFEGRWRALDDEGVLFRDYPRRPSGLPVVVMSAGTDVEALAEAAAVVQALPEEVLGRVTSLDVRSVDGISILLRGGDRVVWGSADESADKAAVLEVLLRREASVYDVTAPGRPTIRR